MKINDAFKEAILLLNKKFIENPSTEAEILIRTVLKFDKKDFILNKDSFEMPSNCYEKLKMFIKKRSKGESLASITNKSYFYNMEFYVNENVLTPRPETELLIEIAEKKIDKNIKSDFLEIGTGSGIISIVLANIFPLADIDSIDVSQKVLEVAEINVKKNCRNVNQINLLKTDMNKLRPDKKYDLIISNPPYIPSGEMKKLIKDRIICDPVISLDGGKDGLDFYRSLKIFSEKYLKKDGYLIFEHGMNQREKIKELFSNRNYEIDTFDDLSGIDRAMAMKENI